MPPRSPTSCSVWREVMRGWKTSTQWRVVSQRTIRWPEWWMPTSITTRLCFSARRVHLQHKVSWPVCAAVALIVAIVATVHTARAAQGFPSDAGVLNVRDFGAKGNGTDDDTEALQAAIDAAGPDTGPAFWRTRIVYLPAGTYVVSRTLARHYGDGKFGSGMILIGESRDATIIRLRDHAPGFDNPDTPRGVIMTTAKLLDGSPTSGGKDYTHKGEGNDAYENFLENLPIDVGNANPGAIGIDYLANNIGAVRNVVVRAPESSGAIG